MLVLVVVVGGGEIVVKIGYVVLFMGGIVYFGKDNENGVCLVVEEVNKEGLIIDGKKIKLELVGEDDVGDLKIGIVVV